jgi:hypothetical protein
MSGALPPPIKLCPIPIINYSNSDFNSIGFDIQLASNIGYAFSDNQKQYDEANKLGADINAKNIAGIASDFLLDTMKDFLYVSSRCGRRISNCTTFSPFNSDSISVSLKSKLDIIRATNTSSLIEGDTLMEIINTILILPDIGQRGIKYNETFPQYCVIDNTPIGTILKDVNGVEKKLTDTTIQFEGLFSSFDSGGSCSVGGSPYQVPNDISLFIINMGISILKSCLRPLDGINIAIKWVPTGTPEECTTFLLYIYDNSNPITIRTGSNGYFNVERLTKAINGKYNSSSRMINEIHAKIAWMAGQLPPSYVIDVKKIVLCIVMCIKTAGDFIKMFAVYIFNKHNILSHLPVPTKNNIYFLTHDKSAVNLALRFEIPCMGGTGSASNYNSTGDSIRIFHWNSIKIWVDINFLKKITDYSITFEFGLQSTKTPSELKAEIEYIEHKKAINDSITKQTEQFSQSQADIEDLFENKENVNKIQCVKTCNIQQGQLTAMQGGVSTPEARLKFDKVRRLIRNTGRLIKIYNYSRANKAVMKAIQELNAKGYKIPEDEDKGKTLQLYLPFESDIVNYIGVQMRFVRITYIDGYETIQIEYRKCLSAYLKGYTTIIIYIPNIITDQRMIDFIKHISLNKECTIRQYVNAQSITGAQKNALTNFLVNQNKDFVNYLLTNIQKICGSITTAEKFREIAFTNVEGIIMPEITLPRVITKKPYYTIRSYMARTIDKIKNFNKRALSYSAVPQGVRLKSKGGIIKLEQEIQGITKFSSTIKEFIRDIEHCISVIYTLSNLFDRLSIDYALLDNLRLNGYNNLDEQQIYIYEALLILSQIRLKIKTKIISIPANIRDIFKTLEIERPYSHTMRDEEKVLVEEKMRPLFIQGKSGCSKLYFDLNTFYGKLIGITIDIPTPPPIILSSMPSLSNIPETGNKQNGGNKDKPRRRCIA